MSGRVWVRNKFDPKSYGVFVFDSFPVRVEKIVFKTQNFQVGSGQIFGLGMSRVPFTGDVYLTLVLGAGLFDPMSDENAIEGPLQSYLSQNEPIGHLGPKLLWWVRPGSCVNILPLVNALGLANAFTVIIDFYD